MSQGFATSAGGNGVDSFTKLMVHCDGADGSTVFTDSSASKKTLTRFGNAQIDTAQSVFGGASGLFDGTGDYVSAAANADFSFGTGDFAIDFRARFNGSVPDTMSLMGTFNLANAPINGYVFVTFGGSLYFQHYTGGSGNVSINIAVSANTWYHIAVFRSGNTIYMAKDGVVSSSGNVTGISIDSGTSEGFTFGRGYADSDTAYFNGWLDEIRVSKGTARWTGSNFTPPTSEYW